MKIYKGEPCYFFVDEETYLRPLCLKCGEKLNKGWLWENGRYGDWDILCHNCGHIIHKKNAEEKETTTTN